VNKKQLPTVNMVECEYSQCNALFNKDSYKKRFCSIECRKAYQEEARIQQAEANKELRSKKLDPKWLSRGKIKYKGYREL